jgi:hypothetical protein
LRFMYWEANKSHMSPVSHFANAANDPAVPCTLVFCHMQSSKASM